jgi:hypothetical protein
MDENEFRIYILKLEKELKDSKEKLFLNRLSKLYDKSLQNCISEIKIDIDQKNNDWNICYKHNTKNYSLDNYLYDLDTTNNASSDIKNHLYEINKETVEKETVEKETVEKETVEKETVEKETVEKETVVIFGKNKKYFIKGGIKYNIYKNSTSELRIINSEYDLELDMEEQYSLINRYANNVNIPECLALSVFLYLSDNKWDDLNIITYLSVI